MRSVVVLGDVRQHKFTADPPLPACEEFWGGALLMERAIRESLERHDVFKSVKIYGYDIPENVYTIDKMEEVQENTESKGLRGIRQWKVQLRRTNKHGHERYCLESPMNVGALQLMPISDELKRCLADNDYGRGESCPDVLVIDDLGLGLGEIEFGIEDSFAVADSKVFSGEIDRLESLKIDSAEAFSQAQADCHQDDDSTYGAKEYSLLEIRKKKDDVLESAEKPIEIVLSRLFRQFNDATAVLQDSGQVYPVEPVCILSASESLPDLSIKTGSKRNVWQHILQSPPLRRRTIAILDAQTLRTKLSISSGLSWERTAQDTIIEFQRHPELQRMLKYGYVVIRFGLTGALLITNQADSESIHSLYFSPEHDDTDFEHSNSGHVLGETSILVATLVEQLTRRSKWRAGQAIYHDLPETLDECLLTAINRFVNHFEAGYGTNPKTYRETLDRNPSVSFIRRSESLLRFYDNGRADERTSLSSIPTQRIIMPPVRSKHWSILGQSCQIHLHQVAENIVLNGPKTILNTMESPINEFISAWLTQTLDSIRTNNGDEALHDFWHIQNGAELRKFGLRKTLSDLTYGPSDRQSRLRQWLGELFHRQLRNLVESLDRGVDSPGKKTSLDLFGEKITA